MLNNMLKTPGNLQGCSLLEPNQRLPQSIVRVCLPDTSEQMFSQSIFDTKDYGLMNETSKQL